MKPFTPYTILLTGATGRIGSAIATHFARQRHPRWPQTPIFRLAVVSRSRERARAAALGLDQLSRSGTDYQQQRQQSSNSAHLYTHGDIASPQFWREAMSKPVWSTASSDNNDDGGSMEPRGTALPPIAALINAAGAVQRSAYARTSPEAVAAQLDANLLAPMYAARFALPSLLRAKSHLRLERDGSDEASGDGGDNGGGGGRELGLVGAVPASPSITHVSSLLASQGGAGAAVYAAAKAGLEGFSRALAEEYGRLGVRVNVVAPGFIESEMTASEDVESIQKAIPAQRFGSAEEVAQAVAFLVGNDYANNCILNLDGGLSAASVTRSVRST